MAWCSGLPTAAETARNFSVASMHTVCRPSSCGPVLQKPLRSKPVPMPDPCTSAQQHCSSVPAAVEQWLSVLQRKRAGLQAPQQRAGEHAQASHDRTLMHTV